MTTMQACKLTSTEDYASCFVRLQYILSKNKKDEFSKQAQEYLGLCADPYRMALVCIKLRPELYKKKSSSFPAYMLVELEKFMGEDCNKLSFDSCLTKDLQTEAYKIAVLQKNTGTIRLFVRCFQLAKIGEILVPLLRSLLKNNSLREVCLLSTLLDLQSHFSTSELIVPLFLENHISVADEFLMSSPAHQKEFLVFLDDSLGSKMSSSDLEKREINDVKNGKDHKAISDTIAKFLKRFTLDPSLCPHFKKYRSLGGLRFMFYKYYIAKDLQQSTFFGVIDDTLVEYPDVHKDLMKLFIKYYDMQTAVSYIAKLKLSLEDIPDPIREHIEKFPEMLELSEGCVGDSQLSLEATDEEAGNFYSLPVSSENVNLVDTIEKFEKCAEHLRASPLLGVDTEWKPTFGTGPSEQAALLQFATMTEVYLLDLVGLQPLLQHCHWQVIGELFSDSQITKLGYGIRCDFKVLSNLHPAMKNGISGAKKVTDLDIVKGILLEEYPSIFTYSEEKHKGLSDLVYRCFGMPLDKRETFSNWAARPLTSSQIAYAAADVTSLIDTYKYLDERAAELGINEWQNVKRKPGHPKKRTKLPPPSMVEQVDTQEPKERMPVNASNFKVICDTMVQGLAKLLRSCGVDAEALNNGDNCDRCVEYYEREKRVAVTRGSSYNRLRKYIPHDYVFSVKSETAREQLAEIIEAFNVKVTTSDVFARCSKCNSDSYLLVPSSVVSTMQQSVSSGAAGCDEWVKCKGGSVNVTSSLTSKGVQIQVDKVPAPVVESNNLFYVCSQCGKCYWEGSHHSKILTGRLKNIVEDDKVALESN